MASFAVCTVGAVNGRSAPSGGSFERSSVGASAGRSEVSGWKRMSRRLRVFEPAIDRLLRRRPASARGSAPDRRRTCPGSPRKVLYWFSRSALPPKPPMRSRPEMNSDSCLVLARSSSAAVGPSFASRAISSVDDPLDSARRARAAPSHDDEGAGDLAASVKSSRRSRAACRRRASCSGATTGRRSGSATAMSSAASSAREVLGRRASHVDALLRHAVADFDDLLAVQRRRPSAPADRAPGPAGCRRSISRRAAWLPPDRSRRR